MGNRGFADQFSMFVADFISVNLWEYLPVGYTESLPLGFGTFGAVSELFGVCTAVVIHGHQKTVRRIGTA